MVGIGDSRGDWTHHLFEFRKQLTSFHLQNIINNNYNSFFDDSIEERINHLLPPFYGAALLKAEAVNKKKVFELLSKISSFSKTLKNHKTLSTAPMLLIN